MTNQKIVIACAVTAVVVGGVGFWGGRHFSQINRGERFAQIENRRPSSSSQPGFGMRGGGVMGEVTAKDDKTLTVKLNDGSSKIIILSNTTIYRVSAESSLDKVEIGTSVVAFGTASNDGTTVATSIEIKQ